MGKKLNKAIKELDEMLEPGEEWVDQELKKDYIAIRKWLKELREYRKLKKKGRLLEIPCAVGDEVYEAQGLRKKVQSYTIIAVHVSNCGKSYGWELKDGKGVYSNVNGFSENALGKTVFLTRQEAEEALARKEWEDA